MLFGLLVFKFAGDIHLKGLGAPPAKKPKKTTLTEGERKGKQLGWGLIALLVVFLATLQIVGIINVTTAQGLAQAMGIIIVSVAMVYFFYILLAGGLDRTEKKREGVLIIFLILAGWFCSRLAHAGTSIQIFSERHTFRTLGNFAFPSSWFQTCNPVFTATLAPVVASLWIVRAQRNIKP